MIGQNNRGRPPVHQHRSPAAQAGASCVTVHPTASRPASPPLAIQFDRLRSLAVTVLNTHADDRGRCAACRCAWPCEPVMEAENNLAAL